MGKILEKLKNFKWGYLLFALLFLGGGIAFIAFPQDGLRVVKLVIGITAIVFAVVYGVFTLAGKERSGGFWSRIVMAAVCAICGGFVITVNDAAIDYLLTAFGIVLMVDASFKAQTSIQSKKYKSPVWWVMLTLAASVLACGVLLMKSDFDFTLAEEALTQEYAKASRLLGIGLVLDGLCNLLSIGYLYFVEKKAKTQVIEELQAEGKMPLILDNDKGVTPQAMPDAPSPIVVEEDEGALGGEITPPAVTPLVLEAPAVTEETTPESGEPQEADK